MPFFELDQETLIPFQRQAIDAGVYEVEIEGLLWNNLEELTGDNLFRVARQARLPHGGIADVIALDAAGRVVVIEVKRDVDRNQLAQALEYAGWARNTSLDELAGMYHGGEDAFWLDWKEFTNSVTPVLVRKDPRLFLVARSFDARTSQALEFLLQHHLPVQLLKVAFYVDESTRRFLNVEWESEPEFSRPGPAGGPQAGTASSDAAPTLSRDFREIALSEVAQAIQTPVTLVWNRPKKGQYFQATLLGTGRIRLADGREFRSPSGAAMAVAEVISYDGWYAWRVGAEGPTLNDLRHQLAETDADQTGPAYFDLDLATGPAVTSSETAGPSADGREAAPESR